MSTAAKTPTLLAQVDTGLRQAFSIAIGSAAMLVGENAAFAAQCTGVTYTKIKTALAGL